MDRWVGVLALAAAAVVAVVLGALAITSGPPWPFDRDDSPEAGAPPASDAAPDGSTAGAGATATDLSPGGYVRSTLDSDGRLVTTHRLVTEEPVRAVQVRLRLVEAYPTIVPVLESLRVVADGEPVAGVEAQLDGGAGTIRLDDPSSTLRLRHVSTGGVLATPTSSSAERALVLVNPLVVRVAGAGEGSIVRMLGDAEVLSLACAVGAELPQPCGSSVDPGWRVRVEESSAPVDVFAQVDLPTG